MDEQKQKNTENNTSEYHKFESYQPHQLAVDAPKAGKVSRANAWLKAHWKLVLAILVAVTVLIGGVIAYLFTTLEYDPAMSSGSKQNQKFYSPLTGIEVEESDTKRPVTGVMIENSPEARPQSGLKDAGVVFESIAEGGITRFLALYQEGKPDTIGPVRSVRAQFASWVAGFDAALAHVGGSDIPLQKLRSGQIKDLDQFFNANAYTRVRDRAAPHNVYTSDEKLQTLNKDKGYTSSDFTSWKRRTKKVTPTPPNATVINVPISTGAYNVTYNWDQASTSYLRSEGGQTHNDREKGQLTPKVVIVMQVPHDVIRDSNGFRYPEVNSSGKAWLFQDGVVTEIKWSKASDKDQIRLLDSSDKAIELATGQTWITAIRPDRVPTWQ